MGLCASNLAFQKSAAEHKQHPRKQSDVFQALRSNDIDLVKLHVAHDPHLLEVTEESDDGGKHVLLCLAASLGKCAFILWCCAPERKFHITKKMLQHSSFSATPYDYADDVGDRKWLAQHFPTWTNRFLHGDLPARLLMAFNRRDLVTFQSEGGEKLGWRDVKPLVVLALSFSGYVPFLDFFAKQHGEARLDTNAHLSWKKGFIDHALSANQGPATNWLLHHPTTFGVLLCSPDWTCLTNIAMRHGATEALKVLFKHMTKASIPFRLDMQDKRTREASDLMV